MNKTDKYQRTYWSMTNSPHNEEKLKDVQHDPKSNVRGYLNKGEEDEMEIVGYKVSRLYQALTWLAIVLSLGLLRLVFHWWPRFMLIATHVQTCLSSATSVLIIDTFDKRYKTYFVKKVHQISIELTLLVYKIVHSAISSNKESDIKKFKVHHVRLADGSDIDVTTVKAVKVKKLWYIWNDEKQSYLAISGIEKGSFKYELHSYDGLDPTEQNIKRAVYGLNEIFVPMQSIPTLLLLEVLNPFYMFQLFALVVWACENYFYYAIAIVLMSLFGISSAVYQTRKNQKSLHDTIHSVDQVIVKRKNGQCDTVDTTQIVPGDIIVIPPVGCLMQCDAILLNGSCVVNESMLTGESVPQLKTPLQNTNSRYNPDDDNTHTLFCGTHVLQTRQSGSAPVQALVIRTGFLTVKGNLVRSILYPPPVDFKFEKDCYRFIWILALIGVCGFLYTIFSKISKGFSIFEIVIDALDLFTIIVPPALPAAMTVGKIYALSRLKKQRISCINSRVINVSGSLDCVCFDKTGTLTEEGLDMWGVVEVKNGEFELPINDISQLRPCPLLFGMTCCHSLTKINQVVTGDPLDAKMFESTNWIFEEPNPENHSYGSMSPPVVHSSNNDDEIGILHQYQFSSKLQRMSVITQHASDKRFIVYCKGSPEAISSLSSSTSVPRNLTETLKVYTQEGFRVLALGWKYLDNISYTDLDTLSRETVETELQFGGLIILENKVKQETAPTIQLLREAKIKVLMITGDNIQTAVSVAKQCGIVNSDERVIEISEENGSLIYNTSFTDRHGKEAFKAGNFDIELAKKSKNSKFSITGKAWSMIREKNSEMIPKMLVQGAIFARMTSDQKQQLVMDLQQIGYCVAMCGDGANDCGALRAAHVGISLSEAEASVASPFTSLEPNISCVPKIIKEGRAALVTSFGVFKFMVLYSITEFSSTCILYVIDCNLTDMEFLFIDIFLVVNFALFFGRTLAYNGPLVPERPLVSLISKSPLISLSFHAVTFILIQVLSFILVHKFPWFVPFQHSEENYNYSVSYENYSVFTASTYQYIIMAVIFSQGPPFRQRWYSNKWFCASILTMTGVCVYITLGPAQWLSSILELKVPPRLDFPVVVLALALTNVLISITFEMYIVEYVMFKKLRYWRHDLDKSKRKYLSIMRDILTDNRWGKRNSSIFVENELAVH